MKIIADRAALLGSLTLAANVVHKRNVSEILGYVLIDGMMGEARFRATDLDMEVSTHSSADVADPGMVTADAVRLREIIQACGSQITLEHGLSDDPRLIVSSGKSRFRIPTLPASSFPKIPDDSWDHSFTVKAIDLKKLLESVAFAASRDIQRQFYLTGVRLELSENTLSAVATNKSRIARSTLAVAGLEASEGVSVPSKTVQQVIHACESFTGDATVSLSRHKIRVAIGKTQLTSKVIEAPYLDVSRAIPVDPPYVAKVDTEALSKSIARTRLTGDPGSEGEGIKLVFREGLLTTSGRSSVSDGEDEIEIDYTGPEFVAGVNAKYALDALTALGSESVEIGFGPDARGLRFTSEENPNVVMVVGLRAVP